MRSLRPLPIFCVFLVGVLSSPSRAQQADELHLELRNFSKDGQTAPGWSVWAQRAEIQPKCFIDTSRFRSAPDALAISGDGNPAEYGGWAYAIKGILAGRTYRLTAYYRARGVHDESRQVVARLDWLDNRGHRVGQPDYAYEKSPDGDWTRTTLSVPAPPGAACARLELTLGWAPQGTVWWDDITFEETQPPPARWVRVGTVSLHPRDNPDNVGAYLKAIDEIAKEKPDIVCLGEEILIEGSSKTYVCAAEEIPGPSTRRLGQAARKYGMYIVAGLTERAGPAIYNTAVLIDRHGNVAGKYRKVFLPREEVEGGLTPGDFFPVFDTDFGRIGILVCWDEEYVDPARAMALQGAEILFLPTAGGYLALFKATALENHLYLVSSGFDVESAIIDPAGQVLFATLASGVNKTIAVNLADRFMDPWLGDMRARFHKEARRDIPMP
jgi:predicted amidohydrolase